MRFSRFTAMGLILVLHVIIPLVLILWTGTRIYAARTSWIVQELMLLSYVTFIFLIGSWVFASVYLRYALVIITVVAAISSFGHIKNLPLFAAPHFSGWMGYGAGLVTAAVLIYFAVGAFRSRFYELTAVNLAFPFKHGTFAVFEGGNGRVSPLMNYHYKASMHKGARTNLSMRYAVDITKLTRWGNDAQGLLPRRNEKYAVFHQRVFSPCEGEVLDVEDKWPNETPWSGTPPYSVGNHVLIIAQDFAVLMGHLQEGSIMVRPGDKVKRGQSIAQAGNSGWTSQPHLHLQAMRKADGSFWTWEGIPVLFEEKNPVKNTLFWKP